jgi:hypothetical protein
MGQAAKGVAEMTGLKAKEEPQQVAPKTTRKSRKCER